MNLLQGFFLIHLSVCAAALLLRLVGVFHFEYITLLIALLVPVWGFVMLILKRVSDLHHDRAAQVLEVEHLHADESMKSISMDNDETEVIPLSEALIVNDPATRRRMMMDIMYDVNRSIVRDSDDLNERAVPLEEAMIVNDPATRRALLIDVLYSNPADYISQLFDAKSNTDTEVVHYAATALTEIQKNYDTQFQKLAKRKVETPDDPKVQDEYQALLESYVSSGLLKGDGLKTQLRQLSRLLGEKLTEREELRGRWTLLNKKASADLQLEDEEQLAWDVERMAEEWPDRENTFLYRMQLAILRKDTAEIRRVIHEIREKDLYVSPSFRAMVNFWEDKDSAGRESA